MCFSFFFLLGVCHLFLVPSTTSFSFFVVPISGRRSYSEQTSSSSTLLPAQHSAIEAEPAALIIPRQHSPTKSRTTCEHCSTAFLSRNALFRHLRTDPQCSLQENLISVRPVKESVAVLFGYGPYYGENPTENSTSVVDMANSTGALLRSTIVESLQLVIGDLNSNTTTTQFPNIELIGSAQASVAKMRHQSLNQEPNCFAVGDVVVINVMVPKFLNMEIWTSALKNTRDLLKPKGINVNSFQLLGPNSKLHGEDGCTQRIYHYLLPFSWLPNATELQDWWKSEDVVESSTPQQHTNKKRAPPIALTRLKNALRSAESVKVPNETIRSDVNRTTFKVAAGRFGQLATRERRPWHNFADPNLRGDASPNNGPVWRVLDRARIVDFLIDDEDNPESSAVLAVLEFKGDSFVEQQVRRIVATAVAITHDWLPRDYVAQATLAQTFVETPLAPVDRLYFAQARYHFEEMPAGGRPFFAEHTSRRIFELDDDSHNNNTNAALNELHTGMLRQLRNCDSTKTQEDTWLEALQAEVCPRILKQLATDTMKPPLPPRTVVGGSTSRTANGSMDSCPRFHLPVLHELRKILVSGQWPDTSVARSAVIRHDQHAHDNDNDTGSYGSFTIVNPNVDKNWDVLPLGNKQFADLVKLVFDFERDLIAKDCVQRVTLVDGVLIQEDMMSPTTTQHTHFPSSHCAVNCNARFTPHVDSGTGAGQSLSMIVGLGPYVGGELRIEGEAYYIQHQAIEFDGWGLRHWTNSFEGERFSLVWFTPERQDTK